MKKAAFFVFFWAFNAHLTFAQSDYSGAWKGAIQIPGINLEIKIDLKKEGNKWVGDMDIPLQNATDLKLADLLIEGRKCSFKMPDVPGNASFSGDFDEKGEKLEGTFAQSGQKFHLKAARESAVKQAEAAQRLQKAVADLRKLADSLRIKRHVPGLGFGIVKDGKILLSDGLGYRDLERKLPATAYTQFAIGSSTKAFTAATLGILVDEGKLAWETPIVRYLPDFQLYDELATREMTAIDLTCHRSGLPRHDLMWYGSSFSRAEIYQRLRYLSPNKSFRTTWQYNNLMFMTAGVVVEKLTGKTWEAFAQEKILTPLGMKNTNFSVTDMAKYKESALGYNTKDKVNTRMDYRNLDAVGPAGNINSTVSDMLQWVLLHLNEGKVGDKQVISEAALDMTHQPHMLMPSERFEKNKELTDPSYGLGWFLYRHKGHAVVEHGGNIDGFTALVYMIPEAEFGLVLLANQNGAGLPSVMARYAADAVLGLEYTDWYQRAYGESDKAEEEKKDEAKPTPKRIENAPMTHPMSAYVGEYAHPGYGVIDIAAVDKTLHLRYNGMDLPLEHWHYAVFRANDEVKEVSLMLNFLSDEAGNITQLSTGLDPLSDNTVFVKTAPRRLSDADFQQKLAGKYRTEDKTELPFTVVAVNGRLTVKVTGQPPYDLEPFQGTEYKLKGVNGYSLEFFLNDKGDVTGAAFNQPDGVYKAKRIE